MNNEDRMIMFLVNDNKKIKLPTAQDMNMNVAQIYFDRYNEFIQKFIKAKSEFESIIRKKEVEVKLFLELNPEKTEKDCPSDNFIQVHTSFLNMAIKNLQQISQIFKYVLTIFSDKEVNNKIKYKEHNFVPSKEILTVKQIKMEILEYFRKAIDWDQILLYNVAERKKKLNAENKLHKKETKDSSLYMDRTGAKLKDSLIKIEKEVESRINKIYYSNELYKYILEQML